MISGNGGPKNIFVGTEKLPRRSTSTRQGSTIKGRRHSSPSRRTSPETPMEEGPHQRTSIRKRCGDQNRDRQGRQWGDGWYVQFNWSSPWRLTRVGRMWRIAKCDIFALRSLDYTVFETVTVWCDIFLVVLRSLFVVENKIEV